MDLGQGQLVQNNRFTSVLSLNCFEKGPTVFEKIGGLPNIYADCYCVVGDLMKNVGEPVD
jgi:hypothetical protein